ncbi:MAG TPA: dienelactone hydrolase family protein [Polyangiaceae bacterium]|nr:dienelactone hydrolase family protein [Polyangiaceae bacterium]
MTERASDATATRRAVLAGALGSGFALAVQPVSAETITTSAAGLDAAEVKIPTSAGEIPAYRAFPLGTGKTPKRHPLVLVVHEIFGVHEHIRDVCRRLANAGYFAVAPDLFVRQGDVSNLQGVPAVRAVVDKVPDAQVLLDLDATLAWASASGHVNPEKVFLTGFCWGGRIAWLYAAHSTKLKAGAAWYGRLVGDQDALRPRHPLELAGLLNAPVLGLYGGQDQAIPLSSVEDMKKALASGSAAAKRSQIQVYPQAGHAFLADYRPSYNPEAAADGWKRMLAWFKAHGA